MASSTRKRSSILAPFEEALEFCRPARFVAQNSGASPCVRWLPPDGPFTPQEHGQWAARMWCLVDSEQQGYLPKPALDCEDFRMVMMALIAPSVGTSVGGDGAPYTRASLEAVQAMEYLFRKALSNGDGYLSFDEFEAFTRTLRRVGGKFVANTAELIFSMFDLDSDQMICKEEFRGILRFFLGRSPDELFLKDEWSNSLCTEDIESGALTFEELNEKENCERLLTLQQFVRWLASSPNPIFREHAPQRQRPKTEAQSQNAQRSASSMDEEQLQQLSGSHGGPDACTSVSSGRSRGPEGAAGLWRRGGLFPTFGSRKPSIHKRSGRDVGSQDWLRKTVSHGFGGVGHPGSEEARPKWDDSLCDLRITNPLEARRKKLVALEERQVPAKLTRNIASRDLFRPQQSMPELCRYLDTHQGLLTKGFPEIKERISTPGNFVRYPEALPAFRRHGGVLSDSLGFNALDLPMRQQTKAPRLRDDRTGKVFSWDSAHMVKQTGERYVNGTNAFKCPGPPPRHLLLLEDDDGSLQERPVFLCDRGRGARPALAA